MEENTELFQISVAPEDDVRVPIYNVDCRLYDITSTNNSDDDIKQKSAKNNKNSCWNCGGDHSLRQCELPHDGRRISQNRAKFASRFEFKRYHADVKKKVYPHLTPGVITDKLREALGVRRNQLPPYIYRMRILGYPPGWLLNAKTEYSGIEMFGKDGNRIPNADEEEGEIGFPGERTSYDESKIITYPGFNSWPDAGSKDESKKYNAPELSFIQSKEDFIKNLKNMNTTVYYQRSLEPTPYVQAAGECDMETEETDEIHLLPDDNKCAFIPPLPDETVCPPPPPPPSSEGEEVNNLNTKEIDDDDKTDEETIKQQEDSFSILNRSMDTPGSTHGKTKSIDLGTPVLKIHSPYSKLPPPDSFKKNISDVINFENLPDSTGAYEKLKDVLKCARIKLSSLKENKMNNSF